MRRVLILDDDPNLRELMTLSLGNYPEIFCETAGSVAEVREVYLRAKGGFDVAILDINLGPGTESGLDAYRWLSQQGFSGKIVFFTGHARNNPLVTEACELPGVVLLEKPVTLKTLVAVVQAEP